MKSVWCVMGDSCCFECGVDELISIHSTENEAMDRIETIRKMDKWIHFHIEERIVND